MTIQGVSETEFEARIHKQSKIVKSRKKDKDETATKAKASGAKVKKLKDELMGIIDDPKGKLGEIREKRQEVRDSEEEHDANTTAKNGANHALDEAYNALLEIVDKHYDEQVHMDFDEAQEGRDDKKAAAKQKASSKASGDTDDWKEYPLSELGLAKTSKGYKDLVKHGFDTLGKFAELMDGKAKGYKTGIENPEKSRDGFNFGPQIVKKINEAWSKKKAELTSLDGETRIKVTTPDIDGLKKDEVVDAIITGSTARVKLPGKKGKKSKVISLGATQYEIVVKAEVA